MTFLLERDRDIARSRFEKASEAMRVAERLHAEAEAAADKAFDRWENRPNDETARGEALSLGVKQTAAVNRHIQAVTGFQAALTVLSKLDDPAELERRVRVAEAHEEWWRSRR